MLVCKIFEVYKLKTNLLATLSLEPRQIYFDLLGEIEFNDWSGVADQMLETWIASEIAV